MVPYDDLLQRNDDTLNTTLKSSAEVERAIEVLRSMDLPCHIDPPKNWDSLAALVTIVKRVSKTEKVLDAGGEYYSAILPQLAKLGFTDLTCINISFKEAVTHSGISYEYGDITRTAFADDYFNAVTCLSVIEHGVNIEAFFQEMSRILKVNGTLIISTDYWHEDIDTSDQKAFGTFIKIFNPTEIKDIIYVAERHNFRLDYPLDLQCADKVIEWKPYQLNYTFIYFVLRKAA